MTESFEILWLLLHELSKYQRLTLIIYFWMLISTKFTEKFCMHLSKIRWNSKLNLIEWNTVTRTNTLCQTKRKVKTKSLYWQHVLLLAWKYTIENQFSWKLYSNLYRKKNSLPRERCECVVMMCHTQYPELFIRWKRRFCGFTL